MNKNFAVFKKSICAFTLAEVLIVLAIVGVVASLTIPTLINKYKEKQTVSALKKAFSTLGQVYKLAEAEYGNPATWGLKRMIRSTDEDGNVTVEQQGNSDLVVDRFSKYLKIVEKCAPLEENCNIKNMEYQLLNGQVSSYQWVGGVLYSMMLQDGALLYYYNIDSACDESGIVCGSFYIDVNGYSKPNAKGKDLFEFYMTTKGIIPSGMPDSTMYSTFATTCSDSKTMNGNACAGWVIYNENMDYLHCDDLSWGGKTSCD